MRAPAWLIPFAAVALTVPVSHGAAPPALAPLEFLLGPWTGGGTGAPGAGSGEATFARGLQERVIVRTNCAEYPATADRPPSRHDDLMIIYADANSQLKADYYDNEGHVIRYAVEPRGAGAVVFVSEPTAGAPRFRLTYTRNDDGTVAGQFEIAPPGQPDAYRPYLSWTMHRTTATPPIGGSAGSPSRPGTSR